MLQSSLLTFRKFHYHCLNTLSGMSQSSNQCDFYHTLAVSKGDFKKQIKQFRVKPSVVVLHILQPSCITVSQLPS